MRSYSLGRLQRWRNPRTGIVPSGLGSMWASTPTDYSHIALIVGCNTHCTENFSVIYLLSKIASPRLTRGGKCFYLTLFIISANTSVSVCAAEYPIEFVS